MARRIQINRLDKDELEYLLTVRGIAIGSFDDMRKSLASAFRMEREGESIKYPPHPYTFDEDEAAISEKLKDIVKKIEDLSTGRKSSEAQKLQTKMAYVVERIEGIVTGVEVELKEKKAELLATALTLMDNLYEKLEELENRQKITAPAALNLLESQLVSHTLPHGIENATGSSPIASRPPRSNSFNGKTIPPHKWDLKKFTGDPRCISVHSFFEKVEELRLARNVSKEMLLDSGIDLFVDKAYQFYKDCRRRVNSWDALVSEFKAEYLSANHNDLLFDELRKRTQHPSETIGVYLAVMASYFDRLGCPISEEARLQIVIRNLHPFYQDRLRDPLPTTLTELRDVCRRMEARRDLMNSYVEPSTSRRAQVLERDLAFVDTGENVDSVETGSTQSHRQNSNSKEIVCFKCKQVGHKAIGCAAPGQKRCFKCNREGYTVRTCPNCSSQSGNGNRRN